MERASAGSMRHWSKPGGVQLIAYTPSWISLGLAKSVTVD